MIHTTESNCSEFVPAWIVIVYCHPL